MNWQKLPDIQGITGAYTPFILEGDRLTVFSNTVNPHPNDMTTFGTLWRGTGTTEAVGDWQPVILPSQIHDQTGKPYIRTSAVVKTSGGFHALLHVGDSYPSQTGYVPALASSSDGITWIYHGKLKIDGKYPYSWSSSGAFVVNEVAPAAVNHKDPARNRFVTWQDGITGINLALIYSADGIDWFFHRTKGGSIKDLIPKASFTPIFMSVAAVGGGFHMISGDKWPCSRNIHLTSKNGVGWRVINHRCPTFLEKGTHLFRDADGTLHAISSQTFGKASTHRTL